MAQDAEVGDIVPFGEDDQGEYEDWLGSEQGGDGAAPAGDVSADLSKSSNPLHVSGQRLPWWCLGGGQGACAQRSVGEAPLCGRRMGESGKSVHMAP